MTNPKNNLVHEYNVDGAPVCLFDLSKSSEKLTEEEYKLLISQFSQSDENKPIFQVITSKGIDLLRDQKFDRINKLLNSYQEFYTKEVVGIENQFTIVHSWMTKNKDSSRHHNHNHQNAMLSVLYYFNENLDDYLMANIFFRHKALINVFPNHHFKFDPTKSANPFAYYTQIVYFAFIRRIQKEKKQQATKYKIIENLDIDDILNNETDLGEYSNQLLDYMKKQLDQVDIDKRIIKKPKNNLLIEELNPYDESEK